MYNLTKNGLWLRIKQTWSHSRIFLATFATWLLIYSNCLRLMFFQWHLSNISCFRRWFCHTFVMVLSSLKSFCGLPYNGMKRITFRQYEIQKSFLSLQMAYNNINDICYFSDTWYWARLWTAAGRYSLPAYHTELYVSRGLFDEFWNGMNDPASMHLDNQHYKN